MMVFACFIDCHKTKEKKTKHKNGINKNGKFIGILWIYLIAAFCPATAQTKTTRNLYSLLAWLYSILFLLHTNRVYSIHTQLDRYVFVDWFDSWFHLFSIGPQLYIKSDR